MKKLLVVALTAIALLTVPSTVSAEVLYENHETYGTLTLDGEVLTAENCKQIPVFEGKSEVTEVIVKGKGDEYLGLANFPNATTLDVTNFDFSGCKTLTIAACPNLKTITGLSETDLASITQISLAGTSISETAFPLVPGKKYVFDNRKGTFKWYCASESARGWALNATDTDGNKLVSNENPLDSAVELYSDMFNFPASIKASEYKSGNFNIASKVSLKSGYNFNYTVSKQLRDSEDDFMKSLYGEQYVAMEIYSDNGITSYGGTVLYATYIDDTVKEEVPEFNEDESDEEENNEKDYEVPEALEKGETFKSGKNSYKVTKSSTTKGEVQFTGTKSAKTVSIPATVAIDGVTYKVTSIAAKAFANNKKITEVTIGNNVKTIGTSAFQGCVKLQKVTIGKNVQTIGTSAFQGCTKLTQVTIPTKVKTIGSKAFYGCSKLQTVKINGTKLTTIGNQAFQNCTKLKSITLPKSVTKIGKQAFKGCKSLKTVTVKSTQKLTVGKQAFQGCNKKLTVKIANSKKYYRANQKALKSAGVKTIKKIK